MEIHEFDTVLLKNGKTASIVDCPDPHGPFSADIGSGPSDWETITVTLDDIVKILPPDTP